jgi:hypothetical protein
MTTSATDMTAGSTMPPLAGAIVALAGTPDDMPGMDGRLERLAELAATRIAGVEYAAAARRHDDGCCTVAAGCELADAVTDALRPESGTGSGTTTMAWPGFRETAAEMGLGLVSVPLFAGSGATIASLDLYGRDRARLAPLTRGICAAYDPGLEMPETLPVDDDGGTELINGFAEALSVRATIQLALTVIGLESGIDDDDAYVVLRLRAVERGVPLLDAATTVVQGLYRNV